MQKKSRTKRVIVKQQIKDQGANPLTPRGKKWIKKEIKKLKNKTAQAQLRKLLEDQAVGKPQQLSYWDWVALHGWRDAEGTPIEDRVANPDSLMLEDDIICDEAGIDEYYELKRKEQNND